MKIRFLKEATTELDDAYVWYEEHSPGIGSELLDEIDRAIKRINRYPESCEIIHNDIRRCIVNRFPYGILYGIDKDTLIVIAVAHLHRNPRYWHSRKKKNIIEEH